MRKNTRWTEELLREKLTTCHTKAEFLKQYGSGAMKAASALGLHVEFFGEDRRIFLSDEEILNIARRFENANAFKHGAYNIYQVALRRKLMAKLAFTPQQESWTDEKIRAAASVYSTKADFLDGNFKAYRAAGERGMLDTLGLGTRTGKYAGLADIVYVWRAVGEVFNGAPVYKIGVTSSHRGLARVKHVARRGGFEFEILFFENVGVGDANRVETLLKRLGESPGYSGIDGASEFRALSNQQLEVALEVLINNAKT